MNFLKTDFPEGSKEDRVRDVYTGQFVGPAKPRKKRDSEMNTQSSFKTAVLSPMGVLFKFKAFQETVDLKYRDVLASKSRNAELYRFRTLMNTIQYKSGIPRELLETGILTQADRDMLQDIAKRSKDALHKVKYTLQVCKRCKYHVTHRQDRTIAKNIWHADCELCGQKNIETVKLRKDYGMVRPVKPMGTSRNTTQRGPAGPPIDYTF